MSKYTNTQIEKLSCSTFSLNSFQLYELNTNFPPLQDLKKKENTKKIDFIKIKINENLNQFVNNFTSMNKRTDFPKNNLSQVKTVYTLHNI